MSLIKINFLATKMHPKIIEEVAYNLATSLLKRKKFFSKYQSDLRGNRSTDSFPSYLNDKILKS